jgi:hypothetical protein
MRPNQALERMAARRAFTFYMTKIFSIEVGARSRRRSLSLVSLGEACHYASEAKSIHRGDAR